MQEEINILASSDPTNGATSISADGSQFSVKLSEPIKIPKNAFNVKTTAEQSTIWWTVPNIITGVNDTFYFNYNDGGGAVDYEIVFPQGLYDVTGFYTTFNSLAINQGLVSGLITFTGDESTQKVVITRNATLIIIDFTQSDTPREILGFDSQTIASNPTEPISTFGDNVAAFNTVNSFLVHSDLVDNGVRLNNTYSQIVANVLIDVTPGSQIVYEPFKPPILSSSYLRGTSKDRLRFWLTNEANAAVNTAGEYWTVRIRISYMLPKE
jgi:hypothetical protein